MSLSELVVWFAFASVAGWLFESAYSVVTTGHWEKRGFLFGPACPIYGAGVVGTLVLFGDPQVTDGTLSSWTLFLCCMGGSAAMELVVSVVLERLFGAVWWDYSNLPLNLDGRICLPASLLFGAVGMVIVYLVVPVIRVIDAIVPSVVFEATALVIAFALGADLTVTVLSLTDLMGKITSLSDEANSRADARVQQAGEVIRSLPSMTQEGGGQVRATLSLGQERLWQTAGALTRRQVRLLEQLRRFSSRNLRENAALLLSATRKSTHHGEEG